MTPEEMLDYLGEIGESNASDYDDCCNGWLGWQITDDGRLVVTFETEDGGKDVSTWRLVRETP